MKDKLEDFIRNNREGFDSEMPGMHVWDAIEKRLDEEAPEASIEKKKAPQLAWMWKVAATVLFVMCTYLVIERQYRPTTQQQSLALQGVEQEPALGEFMQAEAYYTSVIEQKRRQIARFASNEAFLVEDFEADIQALDSMYVVLKEDLKKEQTDRVVDAMVQNLQLRIDILNRQLKILESIQNAKRNEEEDEPTLI